MGEATSESEPGADALVEDGGSQRRRNQNVLNSRAPHGNRKPFTRFTLQRVNAALRSNKQLSYVIRLRATGLTARHQQNAVNLSRITAFVVGII